MNRLIVETAYGKVQGVQEGNVRVWRGIPYAKPPVGEMRFRPPEPPEPWAGVRDATRYGPMAMQMQNSYFQANSSVPSSEDCLYLNIWAPANEKKGLPVLVWIHGGAFVIGAGRETETDGASFAERGDVVFVSFNYRLGVFGFMYLDEISGGEYRGSGNCGILDQIAALKWVKENIERFGGDPDRVTIFGESAGGRSVGLMLSIPAAKGLFRQAIVMSGGLNTYRTAETATATTEKFLASLNLTPKEFRKLKELPAELLASKTPPIRITFGMEPTVDGVVVPKMPMDLLAEGSARGLNVIIGTTTHELFMQNPYYSEKDDKDKPLEEIMERFAEGFGSMWEHILPLIPKEKSREEVIHKLLMLLTYHQFTHTSFRVCEIQAKHGSPARNYIFDWASPVSGYALHFLDVPFVFNNLDAPEVINMTGDGANRQLVADQMHGAWIAFAHTGDPSHPGIPAWPVYDLESRAVMIFHETSRVVHDPRREERLLWDKMGSSIGLQ